MPEIPFAAWISLAALAVVFIVSCLNEDLNVGFLSIALAIVVGGIRVNLNAARVMNAFPLGLFMILAAVTFLFGLASTNGTMEKVAAHALRACGGQPAWLPLITYLLVTVLTTIGSGNIAATALVAPVAMAIAARVGLSAFLMTLLVVGAANGAAFSPFTPTGIISNGLIAKMAPQLPGPAHTLTGMKMEFPIPVTTARQSTILVNLILMVMASEMLVLKAPLRQAAVQAFQDQVAMS